MATRKSVEEPSLSQILARKGGKYLSETEKQELSDSQTPFDVIDVKRTTGTYEGVKRNRWEVTIVLDKKNRVLTIPSHDLRDETMQLLEGFVKKNKKAGPIVLKVREMDNGHSWMSLEEPRKKGAK